MMNRSIGWFQPENRGPALDLWLKLWKDYKFNGNGNSCGNEEDNFHKIMSKLYRIQLADNPASIYDLDNNQHLIRKHSGTPWLKSKDTLYEGIDGLNQEIDDFYEYMRPKPTEYMIRTQLMVRITKTIENLWSDAVVDCFGSFKTNTFLPTSDIDLVVIKHQKDQQSTHMVSQVELLVQMEEHFIREGVCLPNQIRSFPLASVPIIKMTDRITGIRLNIILNMPQVVKSVNLVNEYLIEFPNAMKLLFVIKQFILQRDFNEVFSGGLSSYSLVLMVVHFFKSNANTGVEPKTNLGDLLMRFLELYGRKLNYELVGLKVKDGVFAKKSELLPNMQNGCDTRHAPSLLCIEDPLNEKNNVSKSSYNVEKIRDAFDYAFTVLDKAVGPNQLTVGKSKTILGRIVRITDEVIDKRDSLIRKCNNCCLMPWPLGVNPYVKPPVSYRGNNFRGNNRGNRRNFNPNRNNQNRANNQSSGSPQMGNSPLSGQQPRNGNNVLSNNKNRNGYRPNNGHYNNQHRNYTNFRHQCYYSFDRNVNQQKVRGLQQEDQHNKTLANGTNYQKPEVNGTTDTQSDDSTAQRRRSNTQD